MESPFNQIALRSPFFDAGVSSVFTPLSLFSASEPGAWYDPSDMSTMFQDAAGTTPVTAVEQPVSLIYDKSKSLTLGSELVTNGNFSNGTTGWAGTSSTIDVVSGELRVSNSATTNYGNANQSITCTVGKWYIATISARIGTTPIAYLSIRSGAANGTQVAVAQTSSTTLTTLTVRFLANNTTMFVVLSNDVGGIGATAFFDNISVKEIAGNHAYTPSTATASRPVLSARYNLLTKTEQFDDAVWTKTNVTVANTGYTDPFGGNTARLMLETTATGLHNIRQDVSSVASQHTESIYVKGEGRQYVSMDLLSSSPTSNGSYAGFDLSGSGSVYESGVYGTGFTSVSPTITSVGSGWYRITLTVTTNVGTLRVLLRVNQSTTVASYAGDPTKGIYIWGADLRVANDGVGLPVYQRVNTSTDYDTTNFPMYLRFDGSDDYMLTGTITPGTDKAQVFAGVRKINAASAGAIIEMGATGPAGTKGSMNFFAVSASSYAFGLQGSVSGTTEFGRKTLSTYTDPTTNIVTGGFDLAVAVNADKLLPTRVNGANVAGVYDQAVGPGSGTFLALPMYIGRRNGTTAPFNGRIFGLIVRFGANLDNTQITNTETWMNGKTKAY